MSKKALKERVQSVFNKHKGHGRGLLTGHDLDFMREFFSYHPVVQGKTVGIVKAGKHRSKPGSCFHLVVDKKWKSPSYIKTIDYIFEAQRWSEVVTKFRYAIEPQIRAYKAAYLDRHEVCEYTGRKITSNTCDVHHEINFIEILDIYLSEVGFSRKNLMDLVSDLEGRELLKELAGEFAAVHEQVAILRVIHTDTHKKLTYNREYE